MVPDLRRLPPGQTLVPFRADATGFGIRRLRRRAARASCPTTSTCGTVPPRYSSGPFRYVWPSELDLMARLAGLRLRDRWAGWREEPFTAESPRHVSVWEKPTG